MKPVVSINLCCYNSERYLRDTLESIVAQTFKEWELIVVNDGSLDRTEQIVMQFVSLGYPIVYSYQTNLGPGAARNKALELSSGKYIAFIDHDDLWLPQMLDLMVAQLSLLPDCVLAFCDAEHFDDRGKVIRRELDGYDIEALDLHRIHVTKELIIKNCFIKPLCAVVRAEAIKAIRGFNGHLCYAEDYDVWLRLGLIGDFAFVDKVLARYRLHSNQQTRKLGARKFEETVFAYFEVYRHFAILDRFEMLRAVILRRIAKYLLLSFHEMSLWKNLLNLIRGFPQYRWGRGVPAKGG